MTFWLPRTLVLTAWSGKNSQDGTCLRAAAWKAKSAPVKAFETDARSRTSPRKNLTRASPRRCLISSCFASSRLRTWTLATPLSRRCRSMVDPKEPVPPVMATVEPLMDGIGLLSGCERQWSAMFGGSRHKKGFQGVDTDRLAKLG